MEKTTIPLVTLWDYFGNHTFGMAQYFRGLQGDGNTLTFHQHICRAKIGKRTPLLLNHFLKPAFAVANRKLLQGLRDKTWVLGGQQFVHLIPKGNLQTAAVVVYDLLDLDYPDEVTTGRSLSLLKNRLSYIKYASRIITISYFSKLRIVAHFDIDPEQIEVIPIGVDSAKFHPVSSQEKQQIRNRLGIPSRAFVILYVGSEQRRKNLLTMARALAQLSQSTANILFVKIGKPQSTMASKKFRELLKVSELTKNSVFIDYATDMELPDWYSSADVFVFPSVAEGFGIPLLEAMASGTPIITTKLSSIPEVVGDTAIMVDDPFNPQEWAHRISELIYSPEKLQTMSRRGRARALKFSWSTYRENFIQVITNNRNSGTSKGS